MQNKPFFFLSQTWGSQTGGRGSPFSIFLLTSLSDFNIFKICLSDIDIDFFQICLNSNINICLLLIYIGLSIYCTPLVQNYEVDVPHKPLRRFNERTGVALITRSPYLLIRVGFHFYKIARTDREFVLTVCESGVKDRVDS